MITNEQIKRLVDDCARKGHTIGVRDIAYVLLTREFADYGVAYRSIFGSDKDYDMNYAPTYHNTEAIRFLRNIIDEYMDVAPNYMRTRGNGVQYDDISFEENKAYLLKLKKDTERAIENDEIDKKDGLKILADITVKLNDKFAVQDNSAEQMVVVNCKYNSICECGREIYVPTKEELMEKYNLVEKQ